MLVALPGCTGNSAPAADERADTSAHEPATGGAHVRELACDGLERSILAVEPTRASLRDRFGRADSVLAATEPNRHVRGAVDSLFTVHYPGLVAHVRTPAGGQDLVSRVVVTDNRYVSAPRIGIGATAAEVMAELGEPTRRQPSALVYDCGIAVEQPVTFALRDARVHAISIAYYVD